MNAFDTSELYKPEIYEHVHDPELYITIRTNFTVNWNFPKMDLECSGIYTGSDKDYFAEHPDEEVKKFMILNIIEDYFKLPELNKEDAETQVSPPPKKLFFGWF